ncbi:MAG TPA: hypothetical protein VG347_24385 [Verrucomicrobiae bacterium]|nr:hypothetical protein [Verrucomicrobiae bacterium]
MTGETNHIFTPYNEPDVTYMTTNINVRFVSLSPIEIPIKHSNAMNTSANAQNETMTNLFHQMAAYSEDIAGKHGLEKFREVISRFIAPQSEMARAAVRHSCIIQAESTDEFQLPSPMASKKQSGTSRRRSSKARPTEPM